MFLNMHPKNVPKHAFQCSSTCVPMFLNMRLNVPKLLLNCLCCGHINAASLHNYSTSLCGHTSGHTGTSIYIASFIMTTKGFCVFISPQKASVFLYHHKGCCVYKHLHPHIETRFLLMVVTGCQERQSCV